MATLASRNPFDLLSDEPRVPKQVKPVAPAATTPATTKPAAKQEGVKKQHDRSERGNGRGGRGGARGGDAGAKRSVNGATREYERHSGGKQRTSEKRGGGGAGNWGNGEAEGHKAEHNTTTDALKVSEDAWDVSEKKEEPKVEQTPEEIAEAARKAQILENEANAQSMEEYLAEQEAKAGANARREARKPNQATDKKSTALQKKQEEEDLFARVEKAQRERKEKEKKTIIETSFKAPNRPSSGSDRGSSRGGGRGGNSRGGSRGQNSGRGGAGRGAPRNGDNNSSKNAPRPDVADASAFPVLGR